jgi:hypothetical protein
MIVYATRLLVRLRVAADMCRMFSGCETYKPGSSFYTDDLQVDRMLPVLPPAGMDKAIIWQGQIFSSLITTNHQK